MRWMILVGLLAVTAGCGKNEDYSVNGLDEKLKSPDPNVRYEAARKLGKYGAEAKGAVPDLVAALKDPDETVRMGAAYALGDIGREASEALPALKQALNDKDRGVREAAAYALKRVQGKKK